MKEETREHLDQLLDAYEGRPKGTKKRTDEQLAEERKFVGAFRLRCDQVVRPAMEEIGEHLRTRGYDYKISSRDETADTRGTAEPASITFEFCPPGVDPASRTPSMDLPYVSFVAQRHTQTVVLDDSTTASPALGIARIMGQFSLEETDNDFVQERILAMVGKVLKKLRKLPSG